MMTEKEIQDSRDYLYGYYCGHAGLSAGCGAPRAFKMGYEDGLADEENNLVLTDAIRLLNLNRSFDRDGFLCGSLNPRQGLWLYFKASGTGDPVAEHIWRWDGRRDPVTGQARGWSKRT